MVIIISLLPSTWGSKATSCLEEYIVYSRPGLAIESKDSVLDKQKVNKNNMAKMTINLPELSTWDSWKGG